MKLTFIPQRRDDGLSLSRSGDVLRINGEDFDFSGLPDGSILPGPAVACDWISGEVSRRQGVLHIPIILPLGPNPSKVACFPVDMILSEDGPVMLPVGDAPEVCQNPEEGNEI